MRHWPLCLTICLLLAPTSATASDGDKWQFTLNFPMAWLPDISGHIDTDGDRTDIDIPISDILDNLSAGYIGEFWARRGPWRLGWRTMYLGVETEQTTETVTGIPGRPPIIGKHKLKVENDLFTSDLIASYELNEHFDVYTGIRRTGNKTKFRISALEEGLVELNGRYTIIDEELYDWVLGATLKHSFNNRWRGELQMDYGIDGDNDEIQFVNGFLAYDFNERHSLWFGYRYLLIGNDVKEKGSREKSEFTQQGPTIGWAFSF